MTSATTLSQITMANVVDNGDDVVDDGISPKVAPVLQRSKHRTAGRWSFVLMKFPILFVNNLAGRRLAVTNVH